MASSGSPRDSVVEGVILACGLHVLQIPIAIAATFIASLLAPPPNELGLAGFAWSIVAWGLTQFLYLGPAAWLAFRGGKREKGKGILIVAALGVLLNGACDAVFLRH